MLKTILVALIALAAGGFITSSFEYFLKYNLIDLIKDKILSLFASEQKLQSEIKAEVKKLES